MSRILEDLADPELLEALSANFGEEMACFGRALPGAELHEDAELLWVSVGVGHPNSILQTHFARTDQEYVAARIRATIDHFKARQLESMNWRVTPTATPSDLATHLQAHGFAYRTTTSCMVLEVSQIDTQALYKLPPDGLAITEVTDRAAMLVKREIEQRGFDIPARVAQAYYDVHMYNGFGRGSAWHHYIATLNDKPVAISSLLLHAGLAGIYGITTVPEARRQGVATAITLHTVREAERLGYRLVVLSPTRMSQAIYRRLGFQERAQIVHYTLSLKE